MQFASGLYVFLGRCVGFIPLGGSAVGGEFQQAEGDGAIDHGHVVVVDFVGGVGDLVIVGEVVGDAEGVGGDAEVGEGLVVAAAEEGVAGFLVLPDADAGGLRGLG